MITRILVLSIGTLSLAACAVGPEYKRPEVQLNNNWIAQPDSRVATESSVAITWWKSFNDPALDRLIDLAFRQNLPLKVAGLRIMESRARLGLAIGQQYPQFQAAFGSATAIGLSDLSVNNALIDTDYKDYQLGFDASW